MIKPLTCDLLISLVAAYFRLLDLSISPSLSLVQFRGTTIRRKREECGLNLTQLADQAGISVSWLSRIETDQANPSPGVLKRIALVLHRERTARAAIAEIAQPENEGRDDHPEAPDR
jgi:transcriptional regulator with XRE-family HTH domain